MSVDTRDWMSDMIESGSIVMWWKLGIKMHNISV